MVAYNFQKQFAGDVEAGTKRQTIRAANRCKPGDKLQLYTGMRTKSCRKLRDVVCDEVFPVEICWSHFYIQYSSCLRAYNTIEDKESFARQDGFKSYADLWEWFSKSADEDGVFRGFLILWR